MTPRSPATPLVSEQGAINWWEERRVLSVRLAESEKALRSLRAYADSAGFRFTEGVIARLRSVPIVFTTSRAVVRKIVNRKDTPR
jgi:hypothetical protein